MKILAWLYYLVDRRLGNPKRFEHLYAIDNDPFGCESYAYEQNKFSHLLSLIAPSNPHHILDIGCGAGTLTRLLAERAGRVTAVDFSKKAISIAQNSTKNDNIEYIASDIREFTFKDQYDCIICSEVLYYLTPHEIEQLILSVCSTQRVGTSIFTIEKVDDMTVRPVLTRHLEYISRKEVLLTRRPYAISRYQIRPQKM